MENVIENKEMIEKIQKYQNFDPISVLFVI